MYRIIPDGDGYVKLDAAYLARENCDIIAKSGRKPVICPKSNSSVKGFHPMGQMLKWHHDDPDGFNEVYHERSLVETAFSVIKERFGAVARAKKFVMRKTTTRTELYLLQPHNLDPCLCITTTDSHS